MRLSHIFPAYLFAATLLGTGCGVPEEQYQSALDELKNIKAEMAGQKKSCDDQTAEIANRNKQLADENEVMKTKLVAMGQDISELKTKTGTMFADLTAKQQQIADLQKAQEAERKRAAEFRALVEKFQGMITAGQLDVKVRKGRMLVQMSDQILFDLGRDQIKPAGHQALLEVTQVLKDIPDRHFQVAGHTDNIPIRAGRFRSNWELSTARAVRVVKFMAENGMDPARLSATGYGEFDPVADNTNPDGRRDNRRIEITVMPSIEELPTIDVDG